MPAGRPSSYTDEIAEEILQRVASGESMTAVCKSDHLPDISTVRRWEDKQPEFAARCARARQHQGDSYVDRMDEVYHKLEAQAIDSKTASVLHSILAWKASKLNRGRYGDAKDAGTPDTASVTNVNVNVSNDPTEITKTYQKFIRGE